MRAGDPERLREPARAGAEQGRRFQAAALPHPVEPLRRLERPQEDGSAGSLLAADDVRAPVDPVRAVDVQVPGGPNIVALRPVGPR